MKLAELTRKPDARGFPDYLTNACEHSGPIVMYMPETSLTNNIAELFAKARFEATGRKPVVLSLVRSVGVGHKDMFKSHGSAFVEMDATYVCDEEWEESIQELATKVHDIANQGHDILINCSQGTMRSPTVAQIIAMEYPEYRHMGRLAISQDYMHKWVGERALRRALNNLNHPVAE